MKKIKNIRYGKPGKILFDYNGVLISIKEPVDVVLVGAPIEAAQKWIWTHYGYLLENVS